MEPYLKTVSALNFLGISCSFSAALNSASHTSCFQGMKHWFSELWKYDLHICAAVEMHTVSMMTDARTAARRDCCDWNV